MNIKCFFSHKWDGCKCERCGAIRIDGSDVEHKWVLLEERCFEKCSNCGKERSEHKWNGCKCERCGATRDKEHTWIWNGKCKICGATRNENINEPPVKKEKNGEIINQPTKIERTAFQTAINSQNVQERRAAIIAIKNQSLLQEIVINASAESKNIGLDTLVALRKVNDSDMLENIAKKAKDWGMRARACTWLEDIEILKEISKNDNHDLVRQASTSRIKILGERKPIDRVPSFESLFLQIGLFARGETADGMSPYSYESMSIRNQFVSYGKTVAQVIKSYLMSCAAGKEQYGWWQNSSPLVECIALSSGSSEADRLMLESWLIQLVNVQSNVYEYENNVRRYAQIELDAISD